MPPIARPIFASECTNIVFFLTRRRVSNSFRSCSGSYVEYTPGEELEALAKGVLDQPPEVIEQVRKILGN
jgi:hypothetical protein